MGEWLHASAFTRSESELLIPRAELSALLRAIAERAEAADLTPAELIQTPATRRVLFDALTTSTSTVLITSYRMSTRALGPQFYHALEKALARKVRVAILWGDDDESAQVAADLRDHLAAYAHALHINRNPGRFHAKLVIKDFATPW